MSLTALINALGLSSIGYMVLAIQLYFGFPPFYRKPFYLPPHVTVPLEDIQRGCLLVVPYIFALIVLLWLWATFKLLFIPVVIALVAIKVGLLLRAELRPAKHDIEHSVQSTAPDRPMLVFDIWTIGLSFLLALVILSSG